MYRPDTLGRHFKKEATLSILRRHALLILGFLFICPPFFICPPSFATTARNVGFQHIRIPVPQGRLLDGSVWYPTQAAPSPMALGFSEQLVAQNAAIADGTFPLIIISHGAFGSDRGHFDVAAALAQDGFVAFAPSYDQVGPNFVFKSADWTRQLHGVIDYALTAWPGHSHLDPQRIGAFGFSLGGFVTLVSIGGKPDASRIKPHCKLVPSEWSCFGGSHLDIVVNPPPASAWIADTRIKAAVIAAPALGYVFGKSGLASVRIPIQLWQAQNDTVLAGPWQAEAVRADLPIAPEYHLIPGADHGDFAAPCTPGFTRSNPELCSDTWGFDRAAFHLTLTAEIVRFFRQHLTR